MHPHAFRKECLKLRGVLEHLHGEIVSQITFPGGNKNHLQNCLSLWVNRRVPCIEKFRLFDQRGVLRVAFVCVRTRDADSSARRLACAAVS